jgi:hypothetical protein
LFAGNADLLDGNDGTYYRNASNINAGTLPTARLTGDYTINITGSVLGNAATSTTASFALQQLQLLQHHLLLLLI